MAASLATTDDLADMWRPLNSDELTRASNLLSRASALLRQVAPHVDDRISRHNADPTDPMGLDPVLVATVVATIVKRFISNVEGVASQSVGGYSVRYALRTEKTIRGELQVTQEDLDALRPYLPKSRIGTIRTRAALAPSPLAMWGGFYANSAILATGIYDSLWESELADLGYADEGVALEIIEAGGE